MAGETLINTADDMRWLREVHLPRLPAKYKSAIIVGSEDWPDRIEVYERRDPLVTDVPIVFKADEDGVFEETSKAHATKKRSPPVTRYKKSKVGSSYGGTQWGPDEGDPTLPGVRSMSWGKTSAQLDREIAEVLAKPGARIDHAPIVPKRSHANVKESSDVQNYGTTRFGVALGGLHYRVIIERDWERGGYVAKLVSEGIGTIMEPNGRTAGDAVAALVQDLRAGDATDQKLAARIAKFYWGSPTGDVERRGSLHATKKSTNEGTPPNKCKLTREELALLVEIERGGWLGSVSMQGLNKAAKGLIAKGLGYSIGRIGGGFYIHSTVKGSACLGIDWDNGPRPRYDERKGAYVISANGTFEEADQE